MATMSDDWSVLAPLKPRLRRHIQIHQQRYRDECWYILRDTSSGRYMRFNASAYAFIGRLDGRLSIAEILAALVKTDQAMSQEEVSLLLTQLSALGALNGELPVNAKELFQRYQRERRVQMQRSFMNPLSIRFPLLDPDRLLARMLPWVSPLFSKTAAVLWCLVVGFAVTLGLANVQQIAAAADGDILSPTNLTAMLLLFVLLKTVHEFAHAFAVKNWGGEVHEMGITLLVLAPVPYVDASAAWAFRSKSQRIMVSAAGILTELFLASLALFIWLAVEPGWGREMAFNAMLIASVSTLLFNANPLLKFDGYHVLQDLVEIPNLYTRASRYYLYMIQRYLLGVSEARSPVHARGERGWFLVYGLAAFFYRIVILVAIALFLADKYLFVGVALACWAVAMQLLFPLFRALRYLLISPAMNSRRLRGWGVTVSGIGLLFVLFFSLPVSLTTHAEGVVWMDEQSSLFAGADGFVDELLVEPGDWVDAGTPVVRMSSPALTGRLEVLRWQRRELEVRRAAQRLSDRVASKILEEELLRVDSELKYLKQQTDSLLVVTATRGRLVLPDAGRFIGRYLHQGELIGYLVDPAGVVVRAVVPQSDIGLLRARVNGVEIRLAERLAETLQSTVVRETPAGDTRLPSAALGAGGGGEIAIRASKTGHATAAEAVFHVDLELPADGRMAGIGQRAYVRFDHGSESLAGQLWRNGRQMLLSRLSL